MAGPPALIRQWCRRARRRYHSDRASASRVAENRHPLLPDRESAPVPLQRVDHVPERVRVVQTRDALVRLNFIPAVPIHIDRVEAAHAVRVALHRLAQLAVRVVQLRQVVGAAAADVDDEVGLRREARHLHLVAVHVLHGVPVPLVVYVDVEQLARLIVHEREDVVVRQRPRAAGIDRDQNVQHAVLREVAQEHRRVVARVRVRVERDRVHAFRRAVLDVDRHVLEERASGFRRLFRRQIHIIRHAVAVHIAVSAAYDRLLTIKPVIRISSIDGSRVHGSPHSNR